MTQGDFLMPAEPRTIACYELTPQYAVHHTNCALREPDVTLVLPDLTKECFVAYLSLRGQVRVTEFLASGPQESIVRLGEIRVIAPGVRRAVTFPAGSKLLSLHFSFFGLPRIRPLAHDEAIQALYGRPRGAAPEPRWLIPRHLALGRDLDAFVHAHGELREHVKLWSGEDMGSHQICGYLVSLMYRAFIRQGLRAEDSPVRASPALAHVARARSFIRLNFERRIPLTEVARAVGVNASYLSRCFRRVTGERMVDFLLRTRIEAAKALLADATEWPTVKEVAYQTGFSSPVYFCRAFRRLEKQTALQYAAKERKDGR
jgi:AraC-like DNA-binding protein